MPIFDLYSKRKKRLSGEIPDVYVFDKIPQNLRIQILHIIGDAIGEDNYREEKAKNGYKFVHDTLSREYGLFSLGDHYTHKEAVFNFFLTTRDNDKALDVIELTFRVIDRIIRVDYNYEYSVKRKAYPDDAIKELNERFKENGIGYQYENGQIIKLDSTFIHSEVVKPVISLLWNQKFIGANDEYMKAHDHYKHGRNKECLAECLKSFESVMKIICKEKGWTYDQKDTSKKLIQICFDNNLVPSYMQTQFSSMRSLLESGVPTIRNRVGGHGQGQNKTDVDDYLTRYAMNLTGSNIIFLIEQSGIS